MVLPSFILLILIQITAISCNVEKALFLAPSNLQVPVSRPTFDDLRLDVLSPELWTLKTYIRTEFPTSTSNRGPSTWILLGGLKAGQRYEVRLCWAATQPTSFRLETHEVPTVFETPDLITSLAQYSESRQTNHIEDDGRQSRAAQGYEKLGRGDAELSMLFLQVYAAADYYTMNKSLMEEVPSVHVDIILDPYLFNIFPRSLVSTAVYLIVIAIGSWYLSNLVGQWIQGVSKQYVPTRKKEA